MNKLEYVLGLVAEEATEVAQAALKGNRFGLSDTDPRNGRTNKQNLVNELNDLEGTIRLLREELQAQGETLDGIGDEEAIQAKIEKIMHYAKRSAENGTLVEVDTETVAP